ncbi:MAG: hypothetical protein WA832_22520, partial [Bradyrhizobium sp.]|uniref:hypothetical protein n=1 Tax=Bradyrhizobium sp. TaxID=376 RepID=UPI003C7D8A07
HIYFLIGLRNRLTVAISWLWNHARNQRAARLITQGSSKVGRYRRRATALPAKSAAGRAKATLPIAWLSLKQLI